MPDYTLVLEEAPNYDETPERYESDIMDIMNSLKTLVGDSINISRVNSQISFSSNFTKFEIKEKMRLVFSYHFDNVRCKSFN